MFLPQNIELLPHWYEISTQTDFEARIALCFLSLLLQPGYVLLYFIIEKHIEPHCHNWRLVPFLNKETTPTR